MALEPATSGQTHNQPADAPFVVLVFDRGGARLGYLCDPRSRDHSLVRPRSGTVEYEDWIRQPPTTRTLVYAARFSTTEAARLRLTDESDTCRYRTVERSAPAWVDVWDADAAPAGRLALKLW